MEINGINFSQTESHYRLVCTHLSSGWVPSLGVVSLPTSVSSLGNNVQLSCNDVYV